MGDILFASQSTGGSKLLTHGNRYFQKQFTVVVHFSPPVSLGDKPWTPPLYWRRHRGEKLGRLKLTGRTKVNDHGKADFTSPPFWREYHQL